MSLLLKSLLLATLAATSLSPPLRVQLRHLFTFCSTHSTSIIFRLPGSPGESCPQMEVLRGRDGRDGRDGDKGEKGSTGEKGERGRVGKYGPRGPDGMKGMKGDPGPAGPQGPQGVRGLPGGGTTYIRWGRTTCPTGQRTELLYSGRAGATHHLHKGGAANYLCMPDDPDHLLFQSGVQTDRNYVTGVEYWYGASISSANNHNAPCALCYVATRSVSVMIPAKTVCHTHWTLDTSCQNTTSILQCMNVLIEILNQFQD